LFVAFFFVILLTEDRLLCPKVGALIGQCGPNSNSSWEVSRACILCQILHL